MLIKFFTYTILFCSNVYKLLKKSYLYKEKNILQSIMFYVFSCVFCSFYPWDPCFTCCFKTLTPLQSFITASVLYTICFNMSLPNGINCKINTLILINHRRDSFRRDVFRIHVEKVVDPPKMNIGNSACNSSLLVFGESIIIFNSSKASSHRNQSVQKFIFAVF